MKKVRGSMPTISSILDYWNSDESKENTEWEPNTFDGMREDSVGCCMICAHPIDEADRNSRLISLNKQESFRYPKWHNAGLERSHLHSCIMNGSNHPSNLIMTCRNCNLKMPTCCNRIRALKFLDQSLLFRFKLELTKAKFYFISSWCPIKTIEDLPPFLLKCTEQLDLFEENERCIFKQQSQTQEQK